MNYKPFEIDINNKIRNMKLCIERNWNIPNWDVDKLIRAYKKQEKMIELMAKDLTTPVHDKEWVIEHYKKEAINWTKIKKK